MLNAMITKSQNCISLVPESPEASLHALDRIRDAFVEHLMVDRGTPPVEAQRQASEIFAHELSATRPANRDDFLSIQQNGERVGFLWKTRRDIAERKKWHVLYIETLPPYRKKGIAEAAMRELIDLARKARISELTLNVSPRNTPAVELYNKLGFVTQDGGLVFLLNSRDH